VDEQPELHFLLDAHDGVYSLVLHPTGITLWQAVATVDPTFPMKGPGDDVQARRRPRPRAPDQLTPVRAIRGVQLGRVTRKTVVLREWKGP
jgi:hypothetical protein